ncbi:MAG: alkaline phosphatase D family protein [Phycisphaerales bacterium]|nr:alkaline phosphatase D family protein [Phycisphaerales bacterium]
MRLPVRIFLVFVILLVGMWMHCAAAEEEGGGDFVAGPVVGAVTEKSARVWMQLRVAKPVTITTFEVGGVGGGGGQVSQVSVDVEGPLPFVCDVPVNGLAPNRNYRIEVKLDDVRVKLPGAERIISTSPSEGSEANFCVGLGSNVGTIHGRGTGRLFAEIEKQKPLPRAFLFLGNSASLPLKVEDWPRTNRQAVRVIADAYSKVRCEPDLQGLFRTVPCYAVWNDLDFGVPGSDKTWIYKNEAWSVFQRFWPNPDWGTPENPGCYCNFTIGDAEFFLLDSRMYRDADRSQKPAPSQARSQEPVGASMLGEKQLEWLKKSLVQSTATFKIIACGSQLLAEPSDLQSDTWASFQPEQKDFRQWLFNSGITGVVFLSGGRFGEITSVPPPPSSPSAPSSPTSETKAYPLFELTTGPLVGKTLQVAPENPNRQKAAVLGNQFATLDFGGTREHRFVTLRLRDESGVVQVEQTLFAGQLKR